jgi:membrane-associated phospholipid phosphatase
MTSRRLTGPRKPLAEDLEPIKQQVVRLRARAGSVPVWLLILAVVVLVLTTLDVANQGALTSLDHAVSRRMVRLGLEHHLWAKRVVYLLTLFGQRGSVLVLTIPIVAYLVWRLRSVEPAMRYLLALVALTVAVYALKDGLHRTAPPVDILHTATGASFPSGHLANAVLIWGLLSYSVRSLDPQLLLVRVLNVVRFVGPVCVVIGMTLLNYHWISDFVAGACIGVILLAGVTHPVLGGIAQRMDRRVWPSASLAH